MPRPNCPRRVRMRGSVPWFVPVYGPSQVYGQNSGPDSNSAVPNSASQTPQTPMTIPGSRDSVAQVPGTATTDQAPVSQEPVSQDGVSRDSFASVELTLDELEAIRLADYEGLYQEAAARSMGISRQTFGRIIQQAHRKIAEAVLFGKILKIHGGPIRPLEEEETMMIAVPTTLHGAVDQHFGHCDKFTLFKVDRTKGTILSQETLPSPGECGCRSDIASVLASKGVTVLLTGGIGPGAIRVLEGHGIKVVRGASGRAEQAVVDYLAGRLIDSGEPYGEHEHSGARKHQGGHGEGLRR